MKACTILPTILLLTKDSTCSAKPATQTGKFYFPKITQEDPAYNSSFLSKDSKLDAQFPNKKQIPIIHQISFWQIPEVLCLPKTMRCPI